MGKTTQFYKKAIARALNARESIERVSAEYERQCTLTKNALEAGILGEQGYKQQLEGLEQDKDTRIEGQLATIDEVCAEYAAEMQELGRMDGSRIDDGVAKLLNSGIKLTTAEWQELADVHKDNFLTTRLLKEKYNEAKGSENSETSGFLMGQENKGLGYVRFGQSPQERAEIFERFCGTIRNSCTYKSIPSLGHTAFASRESWWNYCAKDSLKNMRPFEDESFDSVEMEKAFPVEFAVAQPTIF